MAVALFSPFRLLLGGLESEASTADAVHVTNHGPESVR